MHSIAKILWKFIASRLALELHTLISESQIGFIKKRSIQDKSLFMKNIIKEAHSKKIPLLFLKLDFGKVFDSIRWDGSSGLCFQCSSEGSFSIEPEFFLLKSSAQWEAWWHFYS